MAVGMGGIDITLKCATDMRLLQYYPVAMTAEGTIGPGVEASTAIGILQNKPNVGGNAVVRIAGVSKAFVSEIVTFGMLLTVDATPFELAQCDGDGDYVLAQVIVGAGADEFATVAITHGGYSGASDA